MADLSLAAALIEMGASGGGGGGRSIAAASINEAGELEIEFSDGTTSNVGRVVGKDGKVYVPHIDERNVLTFTVEDKAGEIPEPADLNPNDEWSEIDGAEAKSDFVWEGID